MVNLEVTIADEGSYRVSWRLSGSEFASDTQVEVLRSPSFTGPFDTILPPSADITDFVDTQVGRNERPFYRIRIHRSLSPVVEYPFAGGQTVSAEQDSEVRAVIRHVAQMIRDGGARKVLYFPVKSSGPRCHCFDTVSGKKEENCRSCFGTGFQGGFFNPIIVHAGIGEQTTQYSEQYNVQGALASAVVPYIPLVRKYDVIVERENKRWRVVASAAKEYRRNVVRQTLHLAPLRLDHIVQELPVDFSLLGTDRSVVGGP